MPPELPRFHAGERAVQARAGMTEEAAAVGRMIRPEIGAGIIGRIAAAEIVVAATVDAQGELDLSLLTGPQGLASPRDRTTLVVEPEHPLDPRLVANLARDARIGLVGLDLAHRGRFRTNGTAAVEESRRIVVRGEEFFANCPKYIQRHAARVGDAIAPPASVLLPVIASVHTFFVATINEDAGIDVSHRGGSPGVLRATPGGLAWSDYPGNNLFQTLGNISADPRIALLVPDLTAGALLQVNGRAEVLWEGERRTIAVTTVATSSPPYPGRRRFVLVEPSPVNPPEPSAPG